jgi:hypothetical protein
MMLQAREITSWRREEYKAGGELLGFVLVFAVVGSMDEVLVAITVDAVSELNDTSKGRSIR